MLLIVGECQESAIPGTVSGGVGLGLISSLPGDQKKNWDSSLDEISDNNPPETPSAVPDSTPYIYKYHALFQNHFFQKPSFTRLQWSTILAILAHGSFLMTLGGHSPWG